MKTFAFGKDPVSGNGMCGSKDHTGRVTLFEGDFGLDVVSWGPVLSLPEVPEVSETDLSREDLTVFGNPFNGVRDDHSV